MNRHESDWEPMPTESTQLWQSPAGGTTAGTAGAPRSETQWPLAAWVLAAAAVARLLEAVMSSRHLNRETA